MGNQGRAATQGELPTLLFLSFKGMGDTTVSALELINTQLISLSAHSNPFQQSYLHSYDHIPRFKTQRIVLSDSCLG